MRTAILVLGVLGVVACGGRGERRMGQPCQSDQECARGVCVGGVVGEDPACTVSCASMDECPRGWSCSGVTQHNVLVCARGAATPFGIGVRE